MINYTSPELKRLIKLDIELEELEKQKAAMYALVEAKGIDLEWFQSLFAVDKTTQEMMIIEYCS